KDFIDKLEDFEEQEFLPIIKPITSTKDLILMSEKKVSEVKTVLVPCKLYECQDTQDFKILVETLSGEIVVNKETFETKKLPSLEVLNKDQIALLKYAFKNK